MKIIWKYMKGFRLKAALGAGFKMTEAFIELVVPLVMAKIIDIGVKGKDITYVYKMGGVMIFLGVLGFCCALTCQFISSRVSQGVGTAVRNRLFEKVNAFSHAELDKYGAPSLVTRINNDVNQVQLSVAMLIRLVFRAPFLVIGAVIMAVRLDIKLSVIFLTAGFFIAVALYLVMSRSVPFYKVIQRLLDKITLLTSETLEGARVIRAFSKQKTEMEQFYKKSMELRETSIRVSKLSALLNPTTTVIANTAVIAIMWFGGIRVNSDTLTQGEVIALWNYMTQILLAIIVVAELVIIFTKAFASAGRIEEILEEQVSVSDAGNSVLEDLKSDTAVEFKDVSFSYSKNNAYVLSNVSFSVKKGETLGIIGGTGSGKSTVASLIQRFYDADMGTVLVDGEDVKKYPFSQLRRKIGFVPQKAVLFFGTIKSNLLWGNENLLDEEIYSALETAQALDFVSSLKEKILSPVLQGGKNFSGGQKQRLTIARALAMKPEILILDDSLSALDFATDLALRRALKKNTKGSTIIMISQRVNTIKGADKILVLNEGSAAGFATHRELFETCEVYKEICLSQLSREEVLKP